jgi:two-component system chemotaxis response regulator CheB
MTAIRVFLVDDVAAIRLMLARLLEEEPDIVVVGTATNGVEALQRLPFVDAHLIVLDVEMPDMGGLELLRELRRQDNKLPVLLFSSLTERGAMVTIEALLLGANDYVTKPSGLGSAAVARDYIRQQLLPRIRHLTGRALIPKAPVGDVRQLATAAGGAIDAVVIGVSTGGPVALHELVPALPRDLPVPVLIVQHMPAYFTRALTKRLAQVSAIRVMECESEIAVEPGMVIIAAGGAHLLLERRAEGVFARPDMAEPEHFCRPAADVLFRSAATVYGSRTLALVMTGMGEDGLAGCRAIHAAGGCVFIQDAATSVVWGMPGAVQQAGLVSRVLPLQGLADAIVAQAAVGRAWFRQSRGAGGRPA